MFLGKGVLKTCSKFTGKHTCRSVILIKLLCNFIEITLWHGCSHVNLLHILRTPFYKNDYGGLLLIFVTERLVLKKQHLWKTFARLRMSSSFLPFFLSYRKKNQKSYIGIRSEGRKFRNSNIYVNSFATRLSKKLFRMGS